MTNAVFSEWSHSINMWLWRFFTLQVASCALIHSTLCVYAFSPEWWRFPFHWIATTKTTTTGITFPLFSWARPCRYSRRVSSVLDALDALEEFRFSPHRLTERLKLARCMLLLVLACCSSCYLSKWKQTSKRPTAVVVNLCQRSATRWMLWGDMHRRRWFVSTAQRRRRLDRDLRKCISMEM